MPKYGIHHIVLSESIDQLLNSMNQADRSAGSDLKNNIDIAMLGAIGPDLFFWAPDYDLNKKIFTLYTNIEKILKIINDKIVEPIRKIKEAIVEPIENLVSSLAPNTFALVKILINEINDTTKLFISTWHTGLFAGVVVGAEKVTDIVSMFASIPIWSQELFQLFKPPLQDNEPECRWYWFDMLHYRNTGDFARNLVLNATTSSQRAYAYGYLSHIATDVIGHTFVNQIVGGPYRMHVQRHVTVENFMDSWKFKEKYNDTINKVLLDKLQIKETTMTAEIRDLIEKTFHDTYGNPILHPSRLPGEGFLSKEDIENTNEMFFDILNLMKNFYVAPPQEPFSGVGAILAKILSLHIKAPPSPPHTGSGSSCSAKDIFSVGFTSESRRCYGEIFKDLVNFAKYLGEMVLYLQGILLDLLDRLTALLGSLLISELLAILYGIQIILYNIYQTFRSVLALEGFIFPEPDDLNTSHGRNLATTFLCENGSFDYFPSQEDLTVSHLLCASRDKKELPSTRSGFFPRSHLITPNDFMENTNIPSNPPFSQTNLEMYAKATTPLETKFIEGNNIIGNAKDLAVWMIGIANDVAVNSNLKDIVFTNWNLDSDRGYGYKTWKGIIPNTANGTINNLRYVNKVLPFHPNFIPSTSAFHFPNDFPSVPLKYINVDNVTKIPIGDASNGLCGGMVFAVRDYYEAGIPIPSLTTVPSPNSTLFNYLVDRLFDSFNGIPGVSRYMYLMNPILPDDETTISGSGFLHGRSWIMINDEWPKIKCDLDTGKLSPLGLIHVKSTDPFMLGKNHQVLAYKYELIGTDLQIYVYDPNAPDVDNIIISLSIANPYSTTAVQYSAPGSLPIYCFFRVDYAFSQPP